MYNSTIKNKNCVECGSPYHSAMYHKPRKPISPISTKKRTDEAYTAKRTVIKRSKRPKQEERTCKNCSKVFMFKLSQLNTYPNSGRSCSRKCENEYRVKLGTNRPIKDKYGRSGRKADKDWQLAIRLKDNYTCRRCGKYDDYIHTHHVALRSQRPDLKHDVNNGICLCGSCHQWVHHNPKEAKALGFISDEKYGVKRKEERLENIVATKLEKTKSFTVACTMCGKEKKYYPKDKAHISENYRCLDCYQTTHISRPHHRAKTDRKTI